MLKIIFKMIGCFIPIVMLAGFASAKKYDGVTIRVLSRPVLLFLELSIRGVRSSLK